MSWANDAFNYIKSIEWDFQPDWDDCELAAYLRRQGKHWHQGYSWQKKLWPRVCADYLKLWRHQNPDKIRRGK